MSRRLFPIGLYFRQKDNLIFVILCLLLNLASWFWLFFQIHPQAEPIFLHYNILFGVDYVGEWWRIIFLPLSGLAIFLINTTLSWVFYGEDRFSAQFLHAIDVLCQIFILIASTILVFLNV